VNENVGLTELQLAILHVLWQHGEATSREVRRSIVRELADNLFEGKPSQLMSHLLLYANLDRDEVWHLRQALDEAATRSRQFTGPEGGASA
jgi:predicted transcriptional regulator